MELAIFLKGILIGFAMAVPVGPIGIMCIRKTLTDGRLRGLMIGLGAATADLLYGCIAAFGLTAISNAIAIERTWIRLVGGAFLGRYGWWTRRNRWFRGVRWLRVLFHVTFPFKWYFFCHLFSIG
jgi:threonine/homoserine/homoserine lactone efflux protein